MTQGSSKYRLYDGIFIMKKYIIQIMEQLEMFKSNIIEDEIVIIDDLSQQKNTYSIKGYDLRCAYVKYTIDIINRKYHDILNNNKIDNKISLSDCLFSATFKYNVGTETGSHHKANENLRHIIQYIKKRIITGNITRKRFLYPLVLGFLDVPGTKQYTPLQNIDDHPHHHLTFFIHPYTLTAWNELVLREKIINLPFVQTNDIRPLTDPANWIDYSGKYLLRSHISNAQNEELDLIAIGEIPNISGIQGRISICPKSSTPSSNIAY